MIVKNTIRFIVPLIAAAFAFGIMPAVFAPGSTAGIQMPKKPEAASSHVATPSLPFKAHVLVYHSVRPFYEGMTEEVKLYTVTPESFESHLEYLRDMKYNIVSFEDLISASEDGHALPPNPVAITFDDGWENQYTYAFPILKKYNATATFFIFTNAPGHKNWMTWDQIRELSAQGMMIGSHSKSHPYLDRITDEAQLKKEITDSKAILESQIGKEVHVFAYPFGGYTESLASLIKAAGYEGARTFSKGAYHSGDDPFSIKGINVSVTLDQFKKLLLTN